MAKLISFSFRLQGLSFPEKYTCHSSWKGKYYVAHCCLFMNSLLLLFVVSLQRFVLVVDVTGLGLTLPCLIENGGLLS